MPAIPLNDPRYITNLSIKSNDQNLISRNEGGNLIEVTGELMYIETATYIYDNTAINNVLKTNFEYYKFPSRIVVVDDVDLGIVPIEELNIDVPDEPIKIRYRLNEQAAPVLLTAEEVDEKNKNKETSNTRFIFDGSWTLASRIEGSFTELEFGNVLEGMPQTLSNRFTVTQDILDRNADLSFNVKIALRMTDNHGRNNYAARLLRYNPDTNKYAVLAQKTSVSPLSAQYTAYIESEKQKEIDKLRVSLINKRDTAFSNLTSIVDTMIRFVSINENDANSVQTSDLINLFNYTKRQTSAGPKRSGYNNLGYNFWIGKTREQMLPHWFSVANQLNGSSYPVAIAMVISAGQTEFPDNSDVLKKITELKGILIDTYLYEPNQVEELVNTYIHYIYSFAEMWSAVNNNNRAADYNISEFDEYYGYGVSEYIDRIFPGSKRGIRGQYTGLTSANQTIDTKDVTSTDSITVNSGKIKVKNVTIDFGNINKNNYKSEPFASLIKINALINFMDMLVKDDVNVINKNADNTDRNFIPQTALIEPSIYEHNLEANVTNAAADIVSYEKYGLKYAVNAINLYNSLTGSNFKIPPSYNQAYSYIQELIKSVDFSSKVNKLNILQKRRVRNEFRNRQISRNLGQRYAYERRYEQAQRQLKSYQNYEQELKLTDLLTYDPAKLGYLWSSDLPYVVTLNEIIPKTQLRLHDSYAVELVTTPAKSIPHQLIEDQTYWTITELENTEVKARRNETATVSKTVSVINTAQTPKFDTLPTAKQDIKISSEVPGASSQFSNDMTTE